MKIEFKTVLELLFSLLRKVSGERKARQPDNGRCHPSARSGKDARHPNGEAAEADGVAGVESGKDARHPNGETDETDETDEPAPRESCPMATRRAIIEGVGEIRKFAEEHKLAASVVRALLTLLAQLALSSLQGKVNANVLSVMLKALQYEQERWLPEREADDGLPHINSSAPATDGTSIFDVARNASH